MHHPTQPKSSGSAKWMHGLILLAALTAAATQARAQGCTQCRDNAAATPPQTQAAYRHAIILLVVTAATLFTATLLLLKRSR